MRRREFLQTTSVRAGCVVLQGTAMAFAQGDADQRTESRPACSCGTCAGEPGLPYVQDLQTGLYTLILSPRVSVRRASCFFCGGHPQGPWQTHPARCTCGWLATWAADPSSAIQWDHDVLECYVLTSGGERQAHWPIYFCPSCGGLAPGALV
jgi:hypothetical protein